MCYFDGAAEAAMPGRHERDLAMKTLLALSTVALLLAAAPASAMSCCGGMGKNGKPKAGMCGKAGAMAMNHGAMKGTKAACCCEGMSAKMSRRA